MELSYSLVEEDLISLSLFQLGQSERLQRQSKSRRILYPLCFGFLALGTLLTADDLVLPILFGLMALLSFFFVPTLYTWIARRRLPQIVKSKMSSTSIGNRTVTANEKGLQLIAGELYSEVPWSIVHNIVETPSHVFVAIDNIYSLVIPKKEIEADELNQFIAMLRNKINEVDT